MTKGMKSSEFLLTVASLLLKIFGPHIGADFPNEAFLGVAGYAIARGMSKWAGN